MSVTNTHHLLYLSSFLDLILSCCRITVGLLTSSKGLGTVGYELVGTIQQVAGFSP